MGITAADLKEWPVLDTMMTGAVPSHCALSANDELEPDTGNCSKTVAGALASGMPWLIFLHGSA